MADWFEQNGPRLFESLTPEYRHDVISFEGNAQGFRLLTQTENHLFNGGLRLTYATLGAFQKYPCSSRANKPKFGAFISEENILADVAEFLELRRKDDHGWSRHPLAYLVEAADDICYSVIDLEDAVELNILSFEKVKNFLFEVFDGEEKTRIESSLASPLSHRVNLARLRGPLFDKAIEGTIEAFLKGYDRIMEGSLDGSVFDLLDDADPRKKLILGAKDIAKRNVFGDSKKVEIELGCYSIFDTLLNSFCEAALNKADVLNNPAGEHTLKSKSELVLQLLGDHAPSKENAPPKSKWSSYQCLRRVLDYVSGMTDNYAVYIARQLQGVGFAGVQRP